MAAAIIGGCWYLYDSIVGVATRNDTTNVGGNAIAFGQAQTISAGTGTTGGVGADSATTTVFYMHPEDTASSTITGAMQGGTDLSLRILMTASTTGSVLNIAIDTSNNRIDWYPSDFLAINATNEGALNVPGGNTWTWTPAVTTRVGKSIIFPGVIGTYYRVNFQSTVASSTIWAEAQPIVPVPN